MKRVSRSMKLKFMGIGRGKSQPRWKRGIKLIVADTLMRLRPFARARNTSLRSDSKLCVQGVGSDAGVRSHRATMKFL